MSRCMLPVLLVCLAPLAVKSEDWAQWRGPDRTGVSKETGLLKSWPKAGPKLLWEAKGAGSGYASVAISKGKVYTLGDAPSTADDKEEYVTCYDDKDGKQLWKTKLGRVWTDHNADRSGARSTPTIDGGFLYIITPHGLLSCLETATGKEKWKKDLTKDFDGTKNRESWGFSESPLIDGDKVVCTPGGSTATMLALNKNTGATIWQCAVSGNSGAGHASIVISEVGGTRVYVNTTQNKVVGVRASDGKLLWDKSHKGAIAVVPTPIIRGDLVFYAAGYGAGGGLLRQVPGPDKTVKVEEVYDQKTGKGLANKHGGIVLLGDHLFGCADDRNRIWCADLKTGKDVWKEREEVKGSGSVAVTAADGHLYLRASDGTMTLAKASPDGLKQISSFKIPGSGSKPSWAHPVVCNGRLYLREQDRILCYDIKDGASSSR